VPRRARRSQGEDSAEGAIPTILKDNIVGRRTGRRGGTPPSCRLGADFALRRGSGVLTIGNS